jgi:putative tryptophan/tyrosine transport system substrate-binding protein
MRRGAFITLVGGAAALSTLWPLAARTQPQPGPPVIGWLSEGTTETRRDVFAAFHRGLAEAGYAEGRNVAIEYRWARDQTDPPAALAADLVRRQVAVIASTGGTPMALAAKAATSTIPIVFDVGVDPVEIGLVASLNHPAGNLTGVARLTVEVAAKRLELLHELVPAATSIGFLVNPTNPSSADAQARELQAAARVLGVRLLVLKASGPNDLDSAFAALMQQGAGALLVSGNPLFTSRNEQLVALAARHAVPTIYIYREAAAAGGLMSYGPSFSDSARQVGVYTGRILKGDRPADLPVQRLTKIDLVINLKTAKTLGLTVPLTLLGRADEVIE